MNCPRSRGFTLVELAVVLIVIALITAIAIPSYRDYVLRSGRSEARTALMELSNLQEEYYSNRLAYTGTISDLNYPPMTPNNLYQLQVDTDADVHYILQATAINAQANDEACQTFELNGMGQRSATTEECWNR